MSHAEQALKLATPNCILMNKNGFLKKHSGSHLRKVFTKENAKLFIQQAEAGVDHHVFHRSHLSERPGQYSQQVPGTTQD
jgi:hypothetical protein